MTDDTSPKRPRGRPRSNPERAEAARVAAIVRVTTHTRERRQRLVERTLALTPATLARAEALVEARSLDGLMALVAVLVDEETERRRKP